MTMYSLEDGKLAVKIAREVIEKHLRHEPYAEYKVTEIFNQKAGVFVTLEKYPSKDLRGCIGFPEPIFPLLKALKSAAISAAIEDPRFRPVIVAEIDKIIIEVSLLTPPELVKVKDPKEYPKHIKIGQDGLIAEKGWAKGLLLPQVPVEWNWKPEEFLEQVCWKAGLTPDMWLDPNFKLFKFQAEVFSETKPRGDVVRRNLGEK